MNQPFEIAGRKIEPGKFERVEIPVARLYNQLQMTLPVTVLNGRKKGPRLWISSTIHGDELLGLGIQFQLLKFLENEEFSGTLLLIPLVNPFGLLHQSRYLPDRRDLNRCFPGAKKGSLATRIAHIFMKEVVARCTHGIDLHTGSNHRTNLPQIRANLKDPKTLEMAQAFGAPVMIHSETRDGSLRDAAGDQGVPTLLFEAGEPLRHNNEFVQIGVEGIFGVMRQLKMTSHGPMPKIISKEIKDTKWLRSPDSGYLVLNVELGQEIKKKQTLGWVKLRGSTEFFKVIEKKVISPVDGVVIGKLLNPLVHEGDAIIHLGLI